MKKLSKKESVFVGLMLLGAAVLFLPSSRNRPSQPETPEMRQAKQEQETQRLREELHARWESKALKTEAFLKSQEFVKDRLKAPSTAVFADISDPEVIVGHHLGGTYEVLGYVDAQNAFGAMIRSQYYVKLREEQNYSTKKSDWTLEDFKMESR